MRKMIYALLILAAVFAAVPVQAKAEDMELYAQSAVLMDGDTGRILFGKNEQEVRAMASTTKIMTCILVLENLKLDETAAASSRAASQPKVHLGVTEGQEFYVKDLLYSLMLESHNDAAVILAEKTAGSVEAFAQMMNAKAKEIGCENTHFVTPNGLDETDAGGEHATTAAELGKILCYCIRKSPMRDEFLEITRTQSHVFTDVSGGRSYSCVNHNAFLGMMEGALTGKTGFTGKAGYCYVGALESDGRTFVVALLGCGWPNNRSYKWSDTKKLMTYGMEKYHFQTVDYAVDTADIMVENGVPRSGRRRDVCMIPTCVDTKESDAVKLLVSDEDKIEVKCRMKEKLEAPLAKGSRAGVAELFLNEEKIGERAVVTMQKAEKISLPWCARKVFGRFLGVYGDISDGYSARVTMKQGNSWR